MTKVFVVLAGIMRREKEIDWNKRFEAFKALCDKYRGCNGKGGYDCAMAASVGKDIHYQVYMSKEVMGMNPILLSVEDSFPMMEAGRHNLRNISEEFGCAIMSFASLTSVHRRH
jgi:tRNA(Ile)-lysidine synthase TilS/MesJ